LRILRNVGWLTASKAVGAVLSIAYLGLAVRELGPEGFGAFTMVLAYGQAVANFVQFQSWQLVIRFGAGHLEKGRLDRLEALIRFGLWLDIGSACASALLGFFGVLLVRGWLGWSPETAWAAQLFSLGLVGWVRATSTGILRLLDRFDQLSWAEMLTAAIRFAGAVSAALWAPRMGVFLAIWAGSEIAAAFWLWLQARRALRQHGVSLRPGAAHGVTRDNPHLWRFAWSSNATASVNLVWQQLGTLAIGGAMGAAAAGGYRLAFQIAQALSTPTLLLGRVIYPEFTRVEGADGFARMLWRATRLAAVVGGGLIGIAALFGKPLMVLLGGAYYVQAAPLLTILTVAVAIDLAGFALEPALLAAGRAGHALTGRAAGALAYAVLLFLMLERWGVYGAAWAAVIGSAIAAGLSLCLVSRVDVIARRAING